MLNLKEFISQEVQNAVKQVTEDNFCVQNVCEHINWNFLEDKLTEEVKEEIKKLHPYIRVTKDVASCNYFICEDCYEVEIIKNTPPCDTSFKIEMIDNQFLDVTRSELKTLKDMLNNDKVQEFLGI